RTTGPGSGSGRAGSRDAVRAHLPRDGVQGFRRGRCPEPGRWSGRAAGWAPGPLPNPSPGWGGASNGLLLLRRHLRRIRLRLLQHAQDVAAPDVGDLLLGVASLQQALRDPRDLGDIGQALDPATAVPVGADADM